MASEFLGETHHFFSYRFQLGIHLVSLTQSLSIYYNVSKITFGLNYNPLINTRKNPDYERNVLDNLYYSIIQRNHITTAYLTRVAKYSYRIFQYSHRTRHYTNNIK